MSFFTADNFASITGGRWLQRPALATFTGISTDTRSALAGTAFVALRGRQHDGHDHAPAAAQAGAAMVMIERSVAVDQDATGVLLVDNTRRALAALAAAYRSALGATVIAITGSAGKTTAKTLVHAALSPAMRGTCAPRSFNNDIGVPLTILSASPDDQYLLLELGTNAPGEIAALAALAQPDIAAITMIGRSHLAGLGTVNDVAREKASLLDHLRSGGLAIVNADAIEQHRKLAESLPTRYITFGESTDAHIRLTDRGRNGEDTFWFEINGSDRFDLALPGRHNAVNALIAVTIARHLGVDDHAINAGLRRVQPPAMRMVQQQCGGMTIYNDAYNANPDSMIAALDTFAELAADAPRRVVILGDMLELGPAAPALHEDVGSHLAGVHLRCPIDQVILIGELAQHMGLSIDAPVLALPTLDDRSIERIHALLQPGDAVLLKASRGCALERITAATLAHQ